MKLSSYQINSFLKEPDPKVRIILLYGPDAGLVSERAEILAQKFVSDLSDPFRVTAIEGNSSNISFSQLYDEMATPPFGGGKKLVRIRHAGENVASALKELITDFPPTDSVVIIEAGELDKRSKLRALCEGKEANIVSIPCYIEDSEQRKKFIVSFFTEKEKKIDNDAINFLTNILPPNRLAMRNELEKLYLHALDKKIVTINDAFSILANADSSELDDLANAIAERDLPRVVNTLDSLFAENSSPVTILRAVQRHFLRLQMARSYMDNGLSAKASVEKLQPKVFWKYVEPMSRQIQTWSAQEIENALAKLLEGEVMAKKTGTSEATFCSHLLLGLTRK